MADIRDRLNQRRNQLMGNIENMQLYVDGGADPTSRAYEVGRRAVDEVLQIESILAQMQTADAQSSLAVAQREVAAAQREATAASDLARVESEGRAFWLRRFFTSVAVANGAGAFATVAALLRPDAPNASAPTVLLILGGYVLGVAIAGLLPLALAIKPDLRFSNWPWPTVQWLTVAATAVATILFVSASGLVLRVSFATFAANQSNATNVSAKQQAPLQNTAGQGVRTQEVPGPLKLPRSTSPATQRAPTVVPSS